MNSPLQTPFAAVFCNEVLLSAKRIAPYALMILFCANAILWWGWGPAVARGWATNSDFYILRNMGGFSVLLGLPIFTAIIIGDPIVRDFRLGVDPLIFSKPVGRGSYVLGKFLGSFFVLVCCQSAFVITLFVLQWVPFSGMVVLPARALPYFRHFFFMVVISHLVLAAIYFAAGTLTNSAKVVYGLAAGFYPIYIGAALLLRGFPTGLHALVDPMGFSLGQGIEPWSQSADFLNRHVAGYSVAFYLNRAWLIIVSALILVIVYIRFSINPKEKRSDSFTKLTLTESSDRIAYSAPLYDVIVTPNEPSPARERVTLPKVTAAQGSATLFKIIAAVGVEFRLLRAERGLIVLIPLAIFLSFLSVPFSTIATEISYSVTSATNTANMLLVFLACVLVFYTGEAMHRDREVKIEPVVWSTPAPNSVLLLSKWLVMTSLALSLVIVGSLTTIATQLFRGHTPIDLTVYLNIVCIVAVPSIVFLTSLVVALNVILRNKHLMYVVAVGTGAGLFYLYSLGYNHWSYNPLLYQLWKYSDLTSGAILSYRLYCLALAAAGLVLAHIFFERKPA